VALSKAEKIAIERLVNENKNLNDVLDIFPIEQHTSVTRFAAPLIKERAKQEKVQPPKPAYDKAGVLAKLAKAGIHGSEAERLINKALPNVSTRPEVNELYNEIINKLGPRELMIRETDGGKKTVAIMTPGASQKGEKIVGKKDQQDYVFKPHD
jgi:hypothetical protein